MSDSPSPKPPKKRKWRRRLLWSAAILTALYWAINGPISRWALHYAIDTVLEDQGMTGNTQVKGTLTKGFHLKQFDYRGAGGFQQISFSSARADYRLLRELIHGKVRGVYLDDATITIDLDKFVPSESNETTTIKQLKETVELARTWVRQPEISIQNTDLTILQSDTLIAEFKLNKLTHAPQSDHYQLTGFKAKDREFIETPSQDVTIDWLTNALKLSKIEILPEIAILEAQADWAQDLRCHTRLQCLSALLEVKLDDSLTTHLTSGTLTSDRISERFDIELPLDFELNALEAKVTNWLAPLETWHITGTLDLPSISHDTFSLNDTELKLSQQDGSFQIALNTTSFDAPLNLEADGTWDAPESDTWWEDASVRYKFSCPKAAQLPKALANLPATLDLSQTAIQAHGKLSLKALKLHSLDAELSASGMLANKLPLPHILAKANYQHLKTGNVELSLKNQNAAIAELAANYTFEGDLYEASLNINEPSPDWINALLASFEAPVSLNAPLQLSWQGTGHSDLQAPQSGTLTLKQCKLGIADDEELQIDLASEYQWPNSITINSFELREEDFLAQAQILWDGNFLHLKQGNILKQQEPLAKVAAKIPLTTDIQSLENFLAQESPWTIDLDVQPLDIPKINQWLKLHEIKQVADLEGSVAMELDLIGSPHKPELKGAIQLQGLRGIANQDLAPIHMLAKFHSENKRLIFDGELLEGSTQRMTLDAHIPFTPLAWVRDAEDVQKILDTSEVEGNLIINTLPLKRIARIVPQLKEITGNLNGEAKISGKLSDPQVELKTKIDIPLLVIADDTVDDITDIKIECNADTSRKVVATLRATVNGGKFEANANADLKDIKNPIFEVTAKTNHAMVFRNDAISVRANADIKLAGTLEDATLSGEIGVVESLFYKDIDILPIGVPSSAVAKVELPGLDRNKIVIPIPEPFDKWKVDLKVGMQDPLLIRGNIARGQVEGSIRATGTLGDPKLSGKIFANKVVARLPFSELRLTKGVLNFSPENGFIPTLDIQGKSMVNNYDTSIFVYGPATAPRTTFTSYPPLAKNDIMTLLATGVTATGLSNNKEAATLRALQLFLAKLKQESGNSRSTRALETVLSAVEDFEFNINETDGFTGRKFSSAKIKLNQRLYLTAQVDEEKNTRGLVVFVLKFR
ncbi:translocation/assembly module TamB domain-containing protein [Rubritalea tangerina]|uniref:Translocation/assembly module TamB domain-containing protein n=1 Tax=Rubritalea tangerina TaxID=430798 RepID=A0ABW4ZAZ4_9BACT